MISGARWPRATPRVGGPCRSRCRPSASTHGTSTTSTSSGRLDETSWRPSSRSAESRRASIIRCRRTGSRRWRHSGRRPWRGPSASSRRSSRFRCRRTTRRRRSTRSRPRCASSSRGDGRPAGVRILQLYPKEDYFTGAAIQLRHLAWGLKGRGHDVVLATRPSAPWAEKTAEADIPYYPLPMSSEVDLRSVRQLVRLLRRHRIQIVHAQKGKARTLAMMAGLFVQVPVLILNRGVSFPLDPFNRLGYTTRRVTAIVAVCESIKRGLVRQGVDPAKIEVIYSGTDTGRFHPGIDGSGIRKELGLSPEHFLITQIGIRSWKGNDDVLDAMAKVAPQLRQARLLFVGANEAKAKILRDKADARGIA